MKKKLLIGGMCMVGALIAAPAAQAAYPGANGKIVFANATGLASANADGSNVTQLTTDAVNTSDGFPGWSADGTRIAFNRLEFNTGNSEIWVMNADGSRATRLTSGNSDFDPAFLPDGRITFVRQDTDQVGDYEIWIMNGDGGGQTQLTNNAVDDIAPTVSPDGTSIAFSEGDTFFGSAPIFRMDPSGANQTQVTTDNTVGTPFADIWPNYSPDGSKIVFSRCEDSEGCGPINLATVPSGGGSATLLTNNQTFAVPDKLQPAYAPDGSSIVFTQATVAAAKQPAVSEYAAAPSPRGANPGDQLAFIPPTGGQEQPYTAGDEADWQPVKATDLGTCFGQKVTIAGTQGNEVIVGTPGNDVIRGFRGKDKINGKGGDDILCGGRGKDKLFGKAGDDILIGGEQSDYLNGGKGSNRLFGGTPGASPERAQNVCVNGKDDKLSNCQVVK